MMSSALAAEVAISSNIPLPHGVTSVMNPKSEVSKSEVVCNLEYVQFWRWLLSCMHA